MCPSHTDPAHVGAGKVPVGVGAGRAGVLEEALDRVDSGNSSMHQVATPFFQLDIPLAFPWTYASKIAEVAPKRISNN